MKTLRGLMCSFFLALILFSSSSGAQELQLENFVNKRPYFTHISELEFKVEIRNWFTYESCTHHGFRPRWMVCQNLYSNNLAPFQTHTRSQAKTVWEESMKIKDVLSSLTTSQIEMLKMKKLVLEVHSYSNMIPSNNTKYGVSIDKKTSTIKVKVLLSKAKGKTAATYEQLKELIEDWLFQESSK